MAPNLTARENLLLMCGVHGLPRQESLARVEELARTLGLEPVLAAGREAVRRLAAPPEHRHGPGCPA